MYDNEHFGVVEVMPPELLRHQSYATSGSGGALVAVRATRHTPPLSQPLHHSGSTTVMHWMVVVVAVAVAVA